MLTPILGGLLGLLLALSIKHWRHWIKVIACIGACTFFGMIAAVFIGLLMSQPIGEPEDIRLKPVADYGHPVYGIRPDADSHLVFCDVNGEWWHNDHIRFGSTEPHIEVIAYSAPRSLWYLCPQPSSEVTVYLADKLAIITAR